MTFCHRPNPNRKLKGEKIVTAQLPVAGKDNSEKDQSEIQNSEKRVPMKEQDESVREIKRLKVEEGISVSQGGVISDTAPSSQQTEPIGSSPRIE